MIKVLQIKKKRKDFWGYLRKNNYLNFINHNIYYLTIKHMYLELSIYILSSNMPLVYIIYIIFRIFLIKLLILAI